jgi:glycerophosphoryl diester phosphodiesterase
MSPPVSFLTRRPIAHRGFHNKIDVIENCTSAFEAAMVHNYAIECDIQLTKDGQAVVFHDFALERLTQSQGLVQEKTLAQLQGVEFKATMDKMLSLQELFNLVQGKVPLIIEIKSRFNGDLTLVKAAITAAEGYQGEFAFMSFDPAPIAYLCAHAPHIMRGIVAEKNYHDDEWAHISPQNRQELREISHFSQTNPHFLSWHVKDLPVASTTLFREGLKRPVICWTVRSQEDKAQAARFADQVTFEGYEA